jgi:hypothetical protein
MKNANRLLRWPLILLGCVVVGCASMGARRAAPTPATTQSSNNARVLHIADAVPIMHFRTGERDVDLTNRISYSGAAVYYFGQADTYNGDGDVDETTPLVVAKVKGKWCALDLQDERLKNAEWQYIASGPAVGEIWGVLDDSLKHEAKVVLLVHSVDAGHTWTVESIRKPYGLGDYDSFCMDKNGHGRLTFYVEPNDKHPRRGGFYSMHTTDGARTWTAAEHEPDNLQPADEIPEDEDVPPLKDEPTQSA